MTTNQYGVPYRPIGYGTVPSGYSSILPQDATMPQETRYGIVCYDVPLTSDQIAQWQLTPIWTAHQVADAIANSFERYKERYLQMPTDQFLRQVDQRLSRLGVAVSASNEMIVDMVIDRLSK